MFWCFRNTLLKNALLLTQRQITTESTISHQSHTNVCNNEQILLSCLFIDSRAVHRILWIITNCGYECMRVPLYFHCMNQWNGYHKCQTFRFIIHLSKCNWPTSSQMIKRNRYNNLYTLLIRRQFFRFSYEHYWFATEI